ncbi:MAG TPA: YcxB family protein [Pyrinomonadaceae bacterium]|nr:YcxB family protein [Pyrinomonadaceae bacterium]
MEVEYEITPDDLYHYQWRACFHSPSAKRNKRKFYLYLLLIFIVMTLLPAIGSEGFELSQVSLWWLLPLPVLLAVGWIVQRWHARHAILKLVAEEKPGRGQLGAHKISLNEAGLVERTAVNESRHSWAGIDRVEHDQKYIYVYTAPHAALIIPKRAFNNLHEAESFYQLARLSKQAALIN